jgi:hypothetical protein
LQIYEEFSVIKKKRNHNAPSNLFKGDIIKTCQHFLFHLIKGPCTASNAELKLCSTPVLLNEVQLAMVLGIEVAQVTTRFDILLEKGLLRHEVGLSVKDMATAATGLSLTGRTSVAAALEPELAESRAGS